MAEYIVSVEKQADADEIERPYACRKLVLCKDCKHGRLYDGHLIDCELNELAKEADFFCADGERKEGVNE